jgi:hypothetical protein
MRLLSQKLWETEFKSHSGPTSIFSFLYRTTTLGRGSVDRRGLDQR